MATITTGNHNLGQTILIKNNNEKGFLEAESGDGINICGRMEYQRGNVQKGSSQTLSCRGGNDVGVVVENGQKIKTTSSALYADYTRRRERGLHRDQL